MLEKERDGQNLPFLYTNRQFANRPLFLTKEPNAYNNDINNSGY